MVEICRPNMDLGICCLHELQRMTLYRFSSINPNNTKSAVPRARRAAVVVGTLQTTTNSRRR